MNEEKIEQTLRAYSFGDITASDCEDQLRDAGCDMARIEADMRDASLDRNASMARIHAIVHNRVA